MSYVVEFSDLDGSESEREDTFNSTSHLATELDERKFRKKRSRKYFLYALAAVIVVAIVLGVGLGLGLGYQLQKSNTIPEQERDWLSEPCGLAVNECPWSVMPVLLVSLDGFRADYLKRNLTPVIQKLSSCGVHTPYMRSEYPTLTFPNHYTIVTGLYPESHSIVGNNMYDAQINKTFHLYTDNKMNPEWWGGEPFWTTAKKQGKRTASYFWVGSDVNISGSQPDYWMMYNGSVPFEKRIDTVLEWLDMPEGERPDFITLYFNEPDHTGHVYGPASSQVNSQLERVDGLIGRLMNGLYQRKKHNCVNIIIIADHGMAETSPSRVVYLDDFTDTRELLVFDKTMGRINTKYYIAPHINHSRVEVVLENNPAISEDEVVRNLSCKSNHLKTFTKSNLPKRHHYLYNDRIGNIIIDVESRWILLKGHQSNYHLSGNHGYDNLYKSMQALFLAHGPGFKQNLQIAPFENIELYNMLSELLGITPAPNNGTMGALHHVLRNPKSLPVYSKSETYKRCFADMQTLPAVNTASGPPCYCNEAVPGFNFTDGDLSSSVHLPFGLPALEKDDSVCSLIQDQFISGYSKRFHMPVWSSATYTDSQALDLTPSNTPSCIIPDPRVVASQPSCDKYQHSDKNITYSFLFGNAEAGEGNKTEEYLSSNIVPMYTGFKSGIWNTTWDIIGDYLTSSGVLHVTSGPAFDYKANGLWEETHNKTLYVDEDNTVALPTHFYVILVRCKAEGTALNSCTEDSMDILSFIIPHLPEIPNCLHPEEYLRDNVARVRDIELLTGLRFLTRFAVSTSARLRTYLPVQLWTRNSKHG